MLHSLKILNTSTFFHIKQNQLAITRNLIALTAIIKPRIYVFREKLDCHEPRQIHLNYVGNQDTKMAGNGVQFPAIYHYAFLGFQASVIQHEGLIVLMHKITAPTALRL